jgi:hypothetical protein
MAFIWLVAIHHLQCRCRGYVQNTHHAAISPWLAVPVDGGDGPQTYLWKNQKYYMIYWYGMEINLCFMILWYKYTIFMFYGFSKIYDPSPIFMIYWYGMEINLWYEICLLYLEKMIHLILTFMIYLYDIYILKHTIDDQEHLVSIPSYHIWHICIFYISIC